MSELLIHQFPCLGDNYGVLLHDEASGQTAAIDAPDGQAVLDALKDKGWSLTHILVTHHHADHTQGIGAVTSKFDCKVIGPTDTMSRVPSIQQGVDDGDSFDFAGHSVRVIGTPGHTLDMINFYFADQGVVFTGDTLFAMGCGRIFEGNPSMMWASLQKLMALPADTVIYCGHEYTQANADFAMSVDGGNPELQKRVEIVKALRAAGKPTLPTVMQVELDTNPFLRAGDAGIRKNLGMENADDAEVFAEIRGRKDNF
ncbi:MAG: hydroxyacylglutathione hydrolase [Rhizobiaceae bacterium]|nr:hydroxyacylglutathione hydrolase [Rhizobiaceae bacterium]